MPRPSKQARPTPPVDRGTTVIETPEDVRQALIAAGKLPGEPSGRASTATQPTAKPFRPTNRPPIPILTVYDDGKIEGEEIRIRSPKFVIGRTEGDLRIPVDLRMSSKHAEITLQEVGGVHRWVLTDLQSSHGTYVRVTRTPLADRAEFLVGSGRYLFESGRQASDDTTDVDRGEPDYSRTVGWSDAAGAPRPSALTELVGREIGNRTLLVKDEYWIGSDSSCVIGRPDDPFCEPRHLRLYRNGRGGWSVENNKTKSGLWLRVPQITVEAVVQFQIGEQRFRLSVE